MCLATIDVCSELNIAPLPLHYGNHDHFRCVRCSRAESTPLDFCCTPGDVREEHNGPRAPDLLLDRRCRCADAVSSIRTSTVSSVLRKGHSQLLSTLTIHVLAFVLLFGNFAFFSSKIRYFLLGVGLFSEGRIQVAC